MNKKVRVQTFLTVYGVETIEEIAEQFKIDYKAIKNKKNGFDKASGLFQKYVLAITFMYSIPSIKNNLKIFRKVVSEEGGIWKDTVKNSFYIFDVYKVVTAQTEEKLKLKEQNQKPLTFNIEEEILSVKEKLETKNYHVASNQNPIQVRSYYISYLLGLSTGLRITEIFKTAEIRKKGSGYIIKGILKKDKFQVNEKEANFLYLSINEVKGYIKELRTHLNTKLKTTRNKTLKETTENQMNTIFSKVYNNAIKRITKNEINNFHELRHYYTIEGTEVFRREGESDKDVRYRILGHHIKEDSTRTYATIK